MAAKNVKTSKNDIAQLQRELNALQDENTKLKTELQQTKTKRGKSNMKEFFRKSGVIFFITLSIVSFMFFNLSSWVKNTLLDTDTFVSTMQPLIAQPEVQQTLQTEITNALFEKVDVQQELQNALPENIAFLSGPLSSQIESFTSAKVGDILASPQIYNLWGQVLSTIQPKVVGYILNDNNDGVITINDIYTAVSSQISQDSKLNFLTNRQLPEKVGTVTLAEVSWLPEARKYTDALTVAPLIFLVVSLVSFMLAVVLSRKKRNTALVILLLTTLMMFATVAAIALGNWQLGESVEGDYAAASQAVYSTIAAPLENRTYGYAALFGAISLIIILTSKMGFIVKIRTFIDEKIVALARKMVPKGVTAPVWLQNYSHYVTVIAWTVFLLLFIVIGVRIPPEYTEIKNGLFWASFVTLLLYITHVISRALKHTDTK